MGQKMWGNDIGRRGSVVSILEQAEQVAAQFDQGVRYGVAVGTNIPKNPGDAIHAAITFNHQGGGESIQIAWIVAQSNPLPGIHDENRADWTLITQQAFTVNTDSNSVGYSLTLNGVYPTLSYTQQDCRIILLESGNTWQGSVYALDAWFDDVYYKATEAYSGLNATFT